MRFSREPFHLPNYPPYEASFGRCPFFSRQIPNSLGGNFQNPLKQRNRRSAYGCGLDNRNIHSRPRSFPFLPFLPSLLFKLVLFQLFTRVYVELFIPPLSVFILVCLFRCSVEVETLQQKDGDSLTRGFLSYEYRDTESLKINGPDF